jgi:hypothetical protein
VLKLIGAVRDMAAQIAAVDPVSEMACSSNDEIDSLPG